MGLDIYVVRYEDYDTFLPKEREYEERIEALYETWPFDKNDPDKFDEERDAAKAEIAAEMDMLFDLTGYGEESEHGNYNRNKHYQYIEEDHPEFPDHLFKIGYFRSSYNAAGINRVLEERGIPDLYDIFGNNGGEYRHRPDWKLALERATQAKNDFVAWLEENGNYGVAFVEAQHLFGAAPGSKPVESEADALKVTVEQMKREKSDFFGSTGYQNAAGSFWPDGFTIVSAVLGTGVFGMKGLYLGYVADHGWESYIESLQIVIDTCQHVLDQPDPEKYILHWSG